MEKRVRAEVSGRVQGVGFRMFIFQKAIRLGLFGRVGNLDNGNVAIDVQGSEELVTKLLEAAHSGPPAATVSDITVQPLPLDMAVRDFIITA
ncbi:acylphosphatase [Prosthecochloris sp. ZM]|uniref:acylphosphatase n=1 Tax=Prosthecochloris sp. ZM TaxID=2283143 RepID=UPI000DF807A8|nr:acylphosphatase [Prosthecochloris sp. ZM]RDD31160.1 acylphosphatase [Prosthecochloris sp. ZM]